MVRNRRWHDVAARLQLDRRRVSSVERAHGGREAVLGVVGHLDRSAARRQRREQRIDQLVDRRRDASSPARQQCAIAAKDRIEQLAEQIAASWSVGRGSVVAGAVVERRIGAGNFGTVWYAADRAIGEPRAVKIFHIDKLTVGLMTWPHAATKSNSVRIRCLKRNDRQRLARAHPRRR